MKLVGDGNRTWLGVLLSPALFVLWLLLYSCHKIMCVWARLRYGTHEERKKFYEYYH